jgi:uncharacterized DUF497 family protein
MLIDYLPPVVKKIREMQAICSAEQPFFDEATDEIENILCRAFISTADEKGIERFETVYGITPDPSATLEQRRVNLLIRNIKKNLSLSEVLTILYNYTANIELQCDYNKDEAIITLKDEVTDIAVIYKALDEIAPLNIYIKEKMRTENQISVLKSGFYEQLYYNYALGRWKIGRLNFGSRGEKRKIGGDNVKLQAQMLADIKSAVAGDIQTIVVNDTLDITEFTVEETENSVIVNYHIRAADTDNIKKVSFRRADGKEVATLNVDLNIDVDTELTHEFEIEEAAK